MVEKALVTGATGFLGRHVVEALRARGTSVRAVVRSARHALPSDVDVIQGDLTILDGAVERAVQGCDVVFHCAGIIGDRVELELGRAVNVEGTRRVARAAQTAGVRRFVHVSSVAVYGFAGGTFAESAPRVTVGEPYIDTKSGGEIACEEELHEDVLRIVRPSIIYGPGDTGMIPRLVELLKKRVPMIGDGGAPVGLVHVSDVVRGMLAAAENDGTSRVFNLASEDDITWKELTDALCERMQLPTPRVMPLPVAMLAARAMGFFQKIGLLSAPPLTTFAVQFLSEKRRYPIERMRLELGVVPQVQVRAGLQRALDCVASATEPTPALV